MRAVARWRARSAAAARRSAAFEAARHIDQAHAPGSRLDDKQLIAPAGTQANPRRADRLTPGHGAVLAAQRKQLGRVEIAGRHGEHHMVSRRCGCG
ncbi:MAG: hypothetical protein ABIM89_02815, partial [Mycobacteriales bacterium]